MMVSSFFMLILALLLEMIFGAQHEVFLLPRMVFEAQHEVSTELSLKLLDDQPAQAKGAFLSLPFEIHLMIAELVDASTYDPRDGSDYFSTCKYLLCLALLPANSSAYLQRTYRDIVLPPGTRYYSIGLMKRLVSQENGKLFKKLFLELVFRWTKPNQRQALIRLLRGTNEDLKYRLISLLDIKCVSTKLLGHLITVRFTEAIPKLNSPNNGKMGCIMGHEESDQCKIRELQSRHDDLIFEWVERNLPGYTMAIQFQPHDQEQLLHFLAYAKPILEAIKSRGPYQIHGFDIWVESIQETIMFALEDKEISQLQPDGNLMTESGIFGACSRWLQNIGRNQPSGIIVSIRNIFRAFQAIEIASLSETIVNSNSDANKAVVPAILVQASIIASELVNQNSHNSPDSQIGHGVMSHVFHNIEPLELEVEFMDAFAVYLIRQINSHCDLAELRLLINSLCDLRFNDHGSQLDPIKAYIIFGSRTRVRITMPGLYWLVLFFGKDVVEAEFEEPLATFRRALFSWPVSTLQYLDKDDIFDRSFLEILERAKFWQEAIFRHALSTWPVQALRYLNKDDIFDRSFLERLERAEFWKELLGRLFLDPKSPDYMHPDKVNLPKFLLPESLNAIDPQWFEPIMKALSECPVSEPMIGLYDILEKYIATNVKTKGHSKYEEIAAHNELIGAKILSWKLCHPTVDKEDNGGNGDN